MTARRCVVIDRFGNVVERDDDYVLNDGERVRVPMRFTDARQRAVFADSYRADDDNEEQDEGGEYEVTDADRQRVLDARAAYMDRLSAGMRRHQVVTEQSDDLADDDGEEFDHARAAYDAMKRRLSNQWKTKARKQRLPVNEEWTRL
jgi:hypothetical protein